MAAFRRLLATTFLFAWAIAANAQAPLKGSIGPDGYRLPPFPVSVTWRGSQTVIVRTLDRSQPFNGPGDNSKYLRYGAGDPAVIGKQIDGIGSEQNGMRCCLLLSELYRQKGITRTPACLGQEVFDFCITEIGRGGGADWCDYTKFTGKPDPVCGAFCPPCSGRDRNGEPPPGAIAEPATELRLDGATLRWTWAGTGRPNFTAYVRRENAFVLLGTARSSPMRLTTLPEPGELLALYTRVQGIPQAAESLLRVGGEPPPPPPPPVDPPPPPPPVDDLDRRLEEFWRLRLKPLLRELYTPGVSSTGSVKVSVFEEKAATPRDKEGQKKGFLKGDPMSEHVFTAESPQVVFQVGAPPPETTTLSVIFEMEPPSDWKPGEQTRLLHVRLQGVKKKLPKYSEICELKVSANGVLVCELSGFGNKRPEFVEPLKLGKVEAGSASYEVEYDADDGEIAVQDEVSETHIKSGDRPIEVIFGFDAVGKALTAPLGWTLRWEGDSPATWA